MAVSRLPCECAGDRGLTYFCELTVYFFFVLSLFYFFFFIISVLRKVYRGGVSRCLTGFTLSVVLIV